MKSLAITLLFTLIAGGATLACREEGPAERAGEAIDEAADDAKEAVDEAGEKVRDAAEEVRE